MRGIEYQLEQWGHWLANGGDVLPRLNRGSLGMPSGSGRTADITDDHASVIDRAVAMLIQREEARGLVPGAGLVLMLHYGQRLEIQAVAERLRIKRTQAYELRKMGHMWVDGALAAAASQPHA